MFLLKVRDILSGTISHEESGVGVGKVPHHQTRISGLTLPVVGEALETKIREITPL